jgi:hypothetical protein
LGTTDDELKEVMALAMTEGATKIRIQQESTLALLLVKEDLQASVENENKAVVPKEACST